jgi:serine-type D-Ala-D-Ala carboxypeptidase/endopeptidase (penicillin-binding protein 4)
MSSSVAGMRMFGRSRQVSRGQVALIIGLSLGIATSAALAAEPNAATAELGPLAGRLRDIATHNVGGMRVGIRVEQLAPQPVIVYEQNEDQPFKPASNQKIVTTAAAMCTLSPDFAYRTIIGQRGDDLVIIGAGDPSTGDPRMAQAAKESITAVFHRWADALKAKGVRSVAGGLLFDDTIFEEQRLHPHWREQFNTQQWYTAPVGGLNFNDNCVGVVVRPAQGSQPADVTLVPASTYLHVENRTKSGSRGQPVITRSIKDPQVIIVSGSVSRAGSADSAPEVTVDDPGQLFASACRTVLASEGIEIRGETRRQRVRLANGTLPPDLKVLAEDDRKFKEVLWRTNKASINLFAEAIFKTVGAYAGRENTPGVGSYESGRAAVEKFLDKLGVQRGTYVLDDGSGLSHDNRVTPQMLVTILRHMNSHPRHEEWLSNLAVPGEQVGTLKRRMKNLEDRVVAKTGSIAGVSALSGYVKGPGGRLYAFSVLCNDTNRSKVNPHELQDQVCQTLASWSPGGGGERAKAEKSKGQKVETSKPEPAKPAASQRAKG